MGLISALRGAFTPREKSTVGFPSQGYLPALGSMPTASGMLVSQATSLQVSTVFSCVRIRSRDLARCTPQVLSDDGKGNKKIIEDHPLVAIFKKPNRVQTWFEFAEQMHIAFLLRSNAYAVILRNRRGEPTELIPINPDLVTPMESPDGLIFYNIARSGLWLSAVLADEPILVPSADMLHIRDLTFNSLVGISRIALARDAVGLAMVQEQQAARWSGNGARPAGVLQTDKALTEEGAARLKQQWEALQSGIQNTGRTAVLEDGVKWSAMSLTSVDLEFISARLVQVKEIARFWEIPLHKLGENESLPRASIGELNADYVQNVVMSDATRWEQKIEATFSILEEGLEIKFDERGLLRADLATMINSARTGVMSGLLTQNEGRSYIGYGPMPNGDVLLAPVNLAPSGSNIDGSAPGNGGRPSGTNLPGEAKSIEHLVEKAIHSVMQKFNPNQPRGADGKFSSGGSEESESGEEAPMTISHGIKLVIGGVVLTAAAALATALAPEAGVVALAAVGVGLIADHMFTEAAVGSGKIILKELGVNAEHIDGVIHSISNMTIEVKSTGSTIDAKQFERFKTQLAAVADHTRDAMIEHLDKEYPDAPQLQAVEAIINDQCDAYKAALDKLEVPQ